jgi:hypothetical protein
VLSPSTYAFYLALTLAVELPLLAFALGRRCGVRRALLAGLVASGVTHPLLSYAWPHVIAPVTRERWLVYAASGEALVVVVEAAILYLVALRPARGARGRTTAGLLLDAFVVSLAVNAASVGVGMLTW